MYFFFFFCHFCNQPIRSVSFLTGGYIELPPKSLSPEVELLVTFATTNSTGVILAAMGKDAQKQGHWQVHVVSSCGVAEPPAQPGNDSRKCSMENDCLLDIYRLLCSRLFVDMHFNE